LARHEEARKPHRERRRHAGCSGAARALLSTLRALLLGPDPQERDDQSMDPVHGGAAARTRNRNGGKDQGPGPSLPVRFSQANAGKAISTTRNTRTL
jgi:hypothetical protein